MAPEAGSDVVVRSKRPRQMIELEGDYRGGWGWRIAFDTDDSDTLRMRMDNVVPDEQATDEIPAGPYPVMIMDLHRA